MGCHDGWASSGIVVKVAFFIVFISMFCNWLAFTTTSWLVTTSGGVPTGYLGLWRICGTNLTCSQTDGNGNVRYGVVQAFAILGFMTQNVGFILINLFMFKRKCMGNGEVGMGSAVLLIISAIGWLIAVAVFGGEYSDFSSYLHYSYGLAVVACGLGLFGGILMVFGSRGYGHGTVGSK